MALLAEHRHLDDPLVPVVAAPPAVFPKSSFRGVMKPSDPSEESGGQQGKRGGGLEGGEKRGEKGDRTGQGEGVRAGSTVWQGSLKSLNVRTRRLVKCCEDGKQDAHGKERETFKVVTLILPGILRPNYFSSEEGNKFLDSLGPAGRKVNDSVVL